MKSILTIPHKHDSAAKHYCFLPKDKTSIKEVMLIIPGVAINPKYYNSFGNYLSKKGNLVIVVNFRGTGLNDMYLQDKSISITDWAEQDLSSIIKWVKSNYPDVQIHGIGHSMGGYVFGLCPEISSLAKLTLISVPTGSLSEFKYPYKAKLAFYSYLLVPFFSLCCQYANFQLFRIGSNMPLGVVKQFALWIKNTNFIQGVVDAHENKHHLFKGKLVSIHISDDFIAEIDRIKKYSNYFKFASNKEILTINPSDYNIRHIGHIEYFKNRSLWDVI